MTAPGPPFLDAGWRAQLATRLAQDPEFAHVARWCNVAIELSCIEGSARLVLSSGHLEPDGATTGHPQVRVHAPAERWAAFFSADPPAWHNDLLGLARRHSDVELDTGGQTFVRHLRALNRMWEVARAAH
jgi:hypothetical protein